MRAILVSWNSVVAEGDQMSAESHGVLRLFVQCLLLVGRTGRLRVDLHACGVVNGCMLAEYEA